MSRFMLNRRVGSIARDIKKHNAQAFDGGNLVMAGRASYLERTERWLRFRDARVAAEQSLGRVFFLHYDAGREQGG